MTDERHLQIKQIFLRASALSGDERRRCVTEACGDDDAMRREVELLLAHHSGSTIMPAAAPRKPLPADSRSRGSRSRTAWSRAINAWASQLSVSGQMALGAAVVLLLVFVLAWWSQRYVAQSSRNYWVHGLTSMLQSSDEHLTAWFESERLAVEAWSADSKFRRVTSELLGPELRTPVERPPTSVASADTVVPKAGDRLTTAVTERARKDAVVVVWNAEGKVVVGKANDVPTLSALGEGDALRQVAQGKSTVLLPHQCEAFAGHDWCGAGRPIMGVAAPIHDSEGKIIATLFVGAPSMITEFTRRLNSIAILTSGDAFAFDRTGRMLTESRYYDQLVACGVLKSEQPNSVLMPLRDPGVDLTKGEQSAVPYAANYPTLAVARAIGGVDGVEVEGYRDYRGVMCIGGWHWMPKYDMGIVIKLDLSEAYDQMYYLRSFFYARVLLMTAAFALLVWSWYSASKMRKRVADTPRIGPYVLDVPIGEGGMGRVYRAHHALLKRPTAVKIIKPELVNEQTTNWFEREVTLASKLTHPNTIEIYDFGSTEEGQFYCAMELLRGLTLSQVLLIEGALPLARALHVLKQAAASLAEAHEMGLMHRDIKLHNLMLCFLGGEADFLKVLDFGLAKHADADFDPANTASVFNIAGTPLYMAPERLRPPYDADARSDVYSLGVVAFKLLTGRDLFMAESDLEMFNQALHTPPPKPSSVAKQPIPLELDELILRCLAKNPADRPANAGELVDIFDLLASQHPWRQTEAQGWWIANRQRIRDLSPDWDARNFSGFLKAAGSKALSITPASH